MTQFPSISDAELDAKGKEAVKRVEAKLVAWRESRRRHIRREILRNAWLSFIDGLLLRPFKRRVIR